LSKLKFIIKEEDSGLTVEQFLRFKQGISRKLIVGLKKYADGMLQNGEHTRTVDILKTGDELELNLPQTGKAMPLSDAQVPILYEDDDVLVYNKPPDMPCHQSGGHIFGTLASVWAAKCSREGCSEPLRALNRLDKDTTGALVAAKHQAAAGILWKQVSKKYVAAVEGVPEKMSGRIDLPIERERPMEIKRIVSPEGEPAVTNYRVLAKGKNGKYSLVGFDLETGRTHQIRVHMSYIGHPLAGDALYGGSTGEIARQALHCASVSFIQPMSKEQRRIYAPLPDDMRAVLEQNGIEWEKALTEFLSEAQEPKIADEALRIQPQRRVGKRERRKRMKYYIGIDLGGTSIKAALIDQEYRIIKKQSVPTPKNCEGEELYDAMAKLAKELLEPGYKAEWVGIGTPGLADSDRGVVSSAHNLGIKEEEPMSENIKKRLGLPVFISNDANAAAYAEALAGAARGSRNSVTITLGTGVGGGIIIDGRIYAGKSFAAGEAGHTVIEKDGRECSCGRKGCFEAYCSATGLIAMTKQAMEGDRTSKLWEICSGDKEKIDGKSAFDAQAAGDACADAVVKKYISYLACGIANIMNLLDPDVVCIGGGVSAQGESLLAPLREELSKELFIKSAANRVVPAQLGNDAGLIGAAFLGKLGKQQM